MKKCYEFLIARTITKNDKGEVISSNDFAGILIPDAAEEELEKILEKYDNDSFSLIWNLENTFKRTKEFPWAIVFYKEEFRLAGHVVSTRRERKDISLTSYTMPIGHSVEEHGVPSISILLIYSKEPLRELAKKSELFNKAWEQLSDCSEDQNWLCIAESPSEEWIKKASEGDDQLFLEELRIDIN